MIVDCPTAHVHDQDPELACLELACLELACLELAERAEGTEEEIAIVQGAE